MRLGRFQEGAHVVGLGLKLQAVMGRAFGADGVGFGGVMCCRVRRGGLWRVVAGGWGQPARFGRPGLRGRHFMPTDHQKCLLVTKAEARKHARERF